MTQPKRASKGLGPVVRAYDSDTTDEDEPPRGGKSGALRIKLKNTFADSSSPSPDSSDYKRVNEIEDSSDAEEEERAVREQSDATDSTLTDLSEDDETDLEELERLNHLNSTMGLDDEDVLLEFDVEEDENLAVTRVPASMSVFNYPSTSDSRESSRSRSRESPAHENSSEFEFDFELELGDDAHTGAGPSGTLQLRPHSPEYASARDFADSNAFGDVFTSRRSDRYHSDSAEAPFGEDSSDDSGWESFDDDNASTYSGDLQHDVHLTVAEREPQPAESPRPSSDDEMYFSDFSGETTDEEIAAGPAPPPAYDDPPHTHTPRRETPPMGLFFGSEPRARLLVVDSQLVPSPFSVTKRRRQRIDIDDILHDSIILDVEAQEPDDSKFSRWRKIPMGAYRSRVQHTAFSSPVSHPKTKRMLTSPVFNSLLASKRRRRRMKKNRRKGPEYTVEDIEPSFGAGDEFVIWE